ncbi:MAG: MobF family relaxase [Nitrospirota bacterium]
MVSITGISTNQASHYFLKDDYYTRNIGKWYGKGAEELSLAGEVKKEDFERLLKGLDPKGKELVGTGVNGEHRAGLDVTFSAPKSVSILAEVLGDTRVRQAHEKAINRTLNYLEQHFAQARQTVRRVTERINTGNLAIATFEHNTSRELDPQLHHHAVIMNVTQRHDGSWRALSNEEIYNNKMLLGQIYRNELAANLKELGYSIQSDNKGLFEVQGIDQKLIEHFSRRSEQIDAKVKELKDSGQYPNANEQRLREIATLGSRATKKDVDMQMVRKSWMERAEALGYTKESILESTRQATEQNMAAVLNRIEPRANEFDVIRQAASIINEQESAFILEDILKIAGKLTVGEYRIGDLEKAFDELKKDKEIVHLGHTVDYQGNKIEWYTTKEMQRVEKQIINMVRDGHDKVEPTLAQQEAQEAIKRYEAKRQAKDGNFRLTEGQRRAAGHVLSTTDRVIGIQGDAGTGKTTMLAAVREIVEPNRHQIRGLSFTGKAASEIEAASGIKSGTLHSFLNNFDKMPIITEEQLSALKARHAAQMSKLSSEQIEFLRKPMIPNEMSKAIREDKISTFADNLAKSAVTGQRMRIDDITSTRTTESGTTIVKTKADEEWIKDYFKNHGILNIGVSEKNKVEKVYRQNEDGSIRKSLIVSHARWEKEGMSSTWEATIYSQNKSGGVDITTVQISREGNDIAYKDSQTIRDPNSGEYLVKGKETWIVDEASMVGSRQLHDLLAKAKQAAAKVVLIGDIKQLLSIAAGKMFRKLQETGVMKTEKMGEILRQKESPEYEAAIKDVSAKRLDDAFGKLNASGKIHEISDRGKRLEAITKDYTSRKNPKDTIIVTARNADRNQLNAEIREDLKKQGKLSKEEHTFTIRESNNLSPTDKHFAQNYSEGGIVIANKAGLIGRAGSEAKITGVDQRNHLITVQGEDGTRHIIDLKKDGQHLAVYQERERSFSKGDKVVFLKNDRGFIVKNGHVGEVKSIDDRGNMSVMMEHGKTISINLKTQYNYVDHGYAVTDYKSQGQTAKAVIYHADTKNNVNYNQFYVAITRGKQDLRIYTNDKTKLKGLAINEQVKTSTLDFQKEI